VVDITTGEVEAATDPRGKVGERL